MAPADFGKFSNHLLIANFGDGTINAYDLASGKFHGRLRTTDGKKLAIEGLWGISFGNGIADQPTNVLFFAAGPGDETQGLYGRIEPAAERTRAPLPQVMTTLIKPSWLQRPGASPEVLRSVDVSTAPALTPNGHSDP